MAYKNKKNVKWWPNCSVCQYMKKNADYREAVLQSSYLNPQGTETLLSVNARFGGPFKVGTLYKHMKNHQADDIKRGEDAAKVFGGAPVWQRSTANTTVPDEPVEVKELLDTTEQVIEQNTVPRSEYEVGLDDFIKLGRQNVREGKMVITASNYIAAIKVKADIERSNKDRKLDMLKTMFAGAAPKGKDDTPAQ